MLDLLSDHGTDECFDGSMPLHNHGWVYRHRFSRLIARRRNQVPFMDYLMSSSHQATEWRVKTANRIERNAYRFEEA